MLPCSKKDKKEVAGGEVNNDIVVEMKSGEKGNEESELLNKSAQRPKGHQRGHSNRTKGHSASQISVSGPHYQSDIKVSDALTIISQVAGRSGRSHE
ncbi:hypothetical protein AALO_G00175590 [Alosa alosa]|uniref:Uncharacterized protein n=1 Tax=Alosa alosa TaxID=278164 RepID=A0AAV6G901_9TELE|nr:hypothetical protein AALO_G00175590 [Alosa alosa]